MIYLYGLIQPMGGRNRVKRNVCIKTLIFARVCEFLYIFAYVLIRIKLETPYLRAKVDLWACYGPLVSPCVILQWRILCRRLFYRKKKKLLLWLSTRPGVTYGTVGLMNPIPFRFPNLVLYLDSTIPLTLRSGMGLKRDKIAWES